MTANVLSEFGAQANFDNDLQLTIQHPLAGTIPLLGSPLKIPTNPTQMRLPPPLLGEHTDQLLQELFDYDAQVLENLHEQGVL